MIKNVEKTDKLDDNLVLKIPLYTIEALLNGSFKVQKYDVLKGVYCELKGETYIKIDDAKERAKKLNEGESPIIVQ